MWSRLAERIRRSAAWRLALPGIGVVAIGSAAIMTIGFALLASSIRDRGDAWLEAEVASIAAEIAASGRSPTAVELEAEVHELELHEGLRSDHGEAEDEGLFFFVLVGAGGRVTLSAARGPRAALRDVLAAIPADARGMVRLHSAGLEHPVRAVVRDLGGGRRIIGGATPYADAELLEELAEVAIAGWLMMLAVAAPVTWLAVRRVLGRVDRLTEVAATISAEELARRLPEGGDDEIDRLARTFNALLDRAARASEQLRTVADSLAHDLRTPLTAVRGRLEAALASPHSEPLRPALEAAIGDLDGAAALIEADLDAAEAEAGILKLRRESLDLAELVRGLLELYAPAAAATGLALGYAGEAEVWVRADRALLQRAVLNLLDNVLSHLPAGTRVRVGLRRVPGRVVLEVADDGPGFPAGIVERAFERSVRGPGSSGRGLGLALVRAVALAHDGQVALEQPPDGGSVVRVELPVAT